ncbi:Conserved_hypothetical protein [Hexamita inflata]|uniref:Uncharacterized protein n=1 Tax=Hexamita inflata TaxID=28002 RepID=A0AA86NYZ5_9EUKA|nr:Conserved hypothetical protein [Hexamita inflata]CAI9941211.1 Conserved hypothetical protein [Hexamita inflata]
MSAYRRSQNYHTLEGHFDVRSTIPNSLAKEIRTTDEIQRNTRYVKESFTANMKAEMLVGNAMVSKETMDKQNIFADYAVYENKMLARRQMLLELYTQDLYMYKDQLAKIGYDLVIEKGRWKHDVLYK